ncbi:MAG: Gfo/Idh/MocA family protein [Armatimonadota bacterium]
MLKAGIIGCGRIVQEGHVRAFEALKDKVSVTALADPAPECLAAVGEALDVPKESRYASSAELLEARADELDFVDLALPHFLHRDIAIECAEAGVNILSEKPMATTVAEADDMIAAVEKAGICFSVIHNRRYSPVSATVLKLVIDGAIGQPFLIRSEGLGKGHYPGTPGYDPDWRTKSERAGGGCLLDNGYHNLYIARELMGSPVQSVYGCIGTYRHDITVDDTACVLLSHESGGITSVQIAWSTVGGGQHVEEIHGTEGTIQLGRGDSPVRLCQGGDEWIEPELVDVPLQGFAGVIDDYIKALTEGADPPTPGDEARENLRVIEAAYDSAKQGETIRLR